MNIHLRLFLLVGLTGALGSNHVLLAQEPESAVWLEGYWEGTGLQIDKQQWEVQLTVLDIARPMIAYPSLGCSGYWSMEQPGKSKIHYKETITDGFLKCDNGVDAFIKKLCKNKIRVTYYLYSYSEKAIAKAILKRYVPPTGDRN